MPNRSSVPPLADDSMKLEQQQAEKSLQLLQRKHDEMQTNFAVADPAYLES